MNSAILQKLHDYFEQKSPLRTYNKGQLITLAGQAPRGVAFLEEGIIEQYDITDSGAKVSVNLFKPPAFFPMSWAINHTPNTYFFEALTECKLRWADPGDTVAFLQDNPEIVFDLLSRVYKGTDGLQRRLILATSGAARQRLIYELLIEAYRFGKPIDGDEAKRQVRVQQQALAARSGLTRETVSRELHALAESGRISGTKGTMTLDITALEKLLD